MENKDLIIGVLIIALFAALWVIYNFLNYYVYPINYKPVRYDDLVMNTGDLLFVLQYSSPHNFMSGERFSHVGIIVVLDNIPHVLELVYPHVLCTEFKRRVLSLAEGQMFYIKSINHKIDIGDSYLHQLITESKNINYTKRIINYYFKTATTSGEQIITDIHEKKEGICSTFVLWVLNKFKLIDLNRVTTKKIITWLADEYNTHHLPVRRIRFFDGTANVSFSDHINILQGKSDSLGNVTKY